MKDVADTNSSALVSLREAAEQIIEANAHSGHGTGEPVSFRAEEIEELRDLGYVE